MPSSVCQRSPPSMPSASSATAWGWSPAGSKSETTLNGGHGRRSLPSYPCSIPSGLEVDCYQTKRARPGRLGHRAPVSRRRSTALGFVRHANGWSGGLDLGIFDQGVWLLSEGRAPEVSVNARNLFADHLSPVAAAVRPALRRRGDARVAARRAGGVDRRRAPGHAPVRARPRRRHGPVTVAYACRHRCWRRGRSIPPGDVAVAPLAGCSSPSTATAGGRSVLLGPRRRRCAGPTSAGWSPPTPSWRRAPAPRRRWSCWGSSRWRLAPPSRRCSTPRRLRQPLRPHRCRRRRRRRRIPGDSRRRSRPRPAHRRAVVPPGGLPERVGTTGGSAPSSVAGLPVLLSQWPGTEEPFFHYGAPLVPARLGGAVVALADRSAAPSS